MYPNDFYLTQPGLKEKLIQANGVNTQTTGEPVGAGLDGPAFNEEWEYSSIVGILMYLAANTHPDIAYAVNQAARILQNHRHALAIKRILRYLKKTQKQRYVHASRWDLQVVLLSCFRLWRAIRI